MHLAYVYSRELCAATDLLPSNRGRSTLIHSLANAYKLLGSSNLAIINPKPATRQDLVKYHDEDFVDALLALDDPLATQLSQEALADFGLEYDCPVFKGLSRYVCQVAGASLAAAKALCSSTHAFDIAVCFDGGRHHARKSEAYGFCYVNDINLSILHLRTTFERVMYIDLDLHHGDGVEGCFKYTDKVLTCSLHRHGPGFFPRSGAAEDTGKGKGVGYALNVPLKRGLSDAPFLKLIHQVVLPAIRSFAPGAIVVQCGADGLHGDPYKEWNLSIDAFVSAIELIQQEASAMASKTLYLGGGGYNSTLVSRCYAKILAALLGSTLSSDIPEHGRWTQYSDCDYMLGGADVSAQMLDANSDLDPLIEQSRRQMATWA